MTNIEFDVIDMGYDVVSELTNRGVFLTSTAEHLKRIDKAGGFIAGGFAAKIAQLLHDGRSINYAGSHELRNYITMSSYSVVDRSAWKSYVGDVDVYFDDCIKAQDHIRNASFIDRTLVSSTPGGYGYEAICSHDTSTVGRWQATETQLVQYITSYHGNPEEVCNTFDIYNAACAIKGNLLYRPKDWNLLAEKRCIHLVRLNTEYTINRLSKWINKHGYTGGLTEESVKFLNEWAKAELEGLYDSNNASRIETLQKLAKFTKALSAETLMHLAPLYATEDAGYSRLNPAIE